MNKTMRELIKEDHWSTRRLAVAMRITKEDLKGTKEDLKGTKEDLKGVKWEKSNKPYKKLKKKSYLW